MRFLSKITEYLPTSKRSARRSAHTDLITASRLQIKRSMMCGTLSATNLRDSCAKPIEKSWWRAQTVKWETIWRMFNEASLDLSDFRCLSQIRGVGDASFALYEKLTVDAMVSLCPVSPDTLKTEALRWRELGTLIASLHKHCLMHQLDIHNSTRKNSGKSGIKDMKEG